MILVFFLSFLYFNPSLKENLNEITYGSEFIFILKSLCGGLFKFYNTRREVFFTTARNISSIISMSFYWFPFNFRRYDHLSLQEQLYEEQPRKDFRIYPNFGQLWRLLGDIFLIYEIIGHKFRSFSIKELQIIFVLILKQEKPKK